MSRRAPLWRRVLDGLCGLDIHKERDDLWDQLQQARAETAAQRAIIADLGRRLHAAQAGPLGDNPLTTTVRMPRVRSQAVLPFPPKEWTPTNLAGQ